ncbi:hypothetical protein CVT25_013791 [Psilocybe cyanescens]|uniref:Uncharacterized protein n=1 Tax=Psilocybe cyanescens TaxID=93625 RepID=A0A409WTW9_PSICY|nr:hypothetical protein CVT25_013791 [Psilocybe cyanescens]
MSQDKGHGSKCPRPLQTGQEKLFKPTTKLQPPRPRARPPKEKEEGEIRNGKAKLKRREGRALSEATRNPEIARKERKIRKGRPTAQPKRPSTLDWGEDDDVEIKRLSMPPAQRQKGMAAESQTKV